MDLITNSILSWGFLCESPFIFLFKEVIKVPEKMLNTRIQQKHDIEVNWLKAVNFIPKIGEIIVYDPDESHAAARVKIGDGVKTVIELAFIDDAVMNELHVVAKTGSWNDLEDKPFYEEGFEITWDGNPEGLTQLPDMGSTLRFYKVSDSVLSKSDLIGAEAVGVNGDESVTRIISEQDIEELGSGIMLNVQDAIICVTTDFSDDSSIPPLNLEKGIYFNYDPHGIYTASLKKTNIKVIDEKFIPETIARTPNDDEIVLTLLEANALPAILDDSGALMTDEAGNILLV